MSLSWRNCCKAGTVEADWNDLWLLLAKGGGVSRGSVFTQLLSAFNQASVNAQEQFCALNPVPPVECLYETQKTSVAGTKRTVVSPASAGLIRRAEPMLNVDHRTICRFPDMYDPGYMQVLNCLDKIRKCLVMSKTEQHGLHNDNSASPVLAEGIRGGNAVGGNAMSNSPGSNAEGGSAAGGDIEVSSPSYRGGFPLVGGNGTGGNAVGSRAVGGTAVGGSVRWG
ncbi:hypothetical protein J7T55_010920 [Diaporthe amygdali]|uniref:uncharacterized protein n=1 Tax=Phomopsis amygdali TaxID=1214568 RepID=UPI0022FE6AF7|nr:uncharacterized protein J7T55_010920 [Diaporthe amygdali]KAJ0104454.1 hypothetical protein J7T55_010920 [Diaporthe amygdali]